MSEASESAAGFDVQNKPGKAPDSQRQSEEILDGGEPPPEFFTEAIKQVVDRITEVRKSCETLSGWCLASVVAANLRSNRPNTWAITLGILGVAVGLYGSTLRSIPYGKDSQDQLVSLRAVLKRRSLARYVVIGFLAAALAMLLIDTWFPRVLN